MHALPIVSWCMKIICSQNQWINPSPIYVHWPSSLISYGKTESLRQISYSAMVLCSNSQKCTQSTGLQIIGSGERFHLSMPDVYGFQTESSWSHTIRRRCNQFNRLVHWQTHHRTTSNQYILVHPFKCLLKHWCSTPVIISLLVSHDEYSPPPYLSHPPPFSLSGFLCCTMMFFWLHYTVLHCS